MSSWIESLDVNTYVQQLLQKNVDQVNSTAQIKIDQLSTTQTTWKNQVSSYGQLQSLLNTFNQNISTLQKSFSPAYQVSSSDTTVATAQINGTATPGNHQLTVSKLAQAEKVASSTVTTTNSLGMTNTLTLGIGATSYNVTVGPDDTLQDISDKINIGASANSLGITSSVVNVANGQYKLIVSSTETGTDNAVNISETGTGSNALNISTGVGGTGTILTSAQNAEFTFDNLSYNLSSNTNTIDGLTLTLLKQSSATISVSQTDPTTNVTKAMQDVVNSYNQIMTYIAQTQGTSKTPDPTLSLIQSTLSNAIVNSPTLTALGIVPMPWNEVSTFTVTLQDNTTIASRPTGLIKINTDSSSGQTFSAAVQSDLDGVKGQLFGDNKLFTQVSDMLKTSTGSVWKVLNDPTSGAIQTANNKISDLQTQITKINDTTAKTKDDLIKQYAQLDLMLGNMQVTSQYLTSQIDAMNQK